MKKIYILLSSLLIVTTSLFAGDHSGTIVSGGINRTFEYYTPNVGMTTNLPLLFVFHGTGGTGSGIRSTTGFNAIAESEKFIVVYPNATMIGSNREWNVYIDDQPGHGGINVSNAPDDVLFTEDMIDYFCINYGIDRNRVYASGHSNGGFMCYNLAFQLDDKIAAIAPVAGNLWGDNTFIADALNNGKAQLPILHLHGDADGVVTIPSYDPNTNWHWPLGSIGYRVCGNHTNTQTNIASTIFKHTYCSASKEIALIRFAGHGHGWPNIAGYSTSQEIWNFLSDYSTSTLPDLSALSNH